MKKSFLFIIAAMCLLVSACSESENTDTTAAVGILSAKITPANSAVSYNCAVDQTTLKIYNTADPVQWDVTDACLQQTTLTVSTTLGGTAYYNGTAIGSDGVVIDATKTITVEVKDGSGTTKSYTLTVTRSTEATGDDMVIKASAFKGFPTGVIDYDMAYFNDRFYAHVVSVSGETENYQLFTSVDGVNWTEVNYQTTTTGITLPEGQSAYVIGGEGAHFTVFNNKLYLIGGARTKGADKYGNEAETDWGMATISDWRSYSTSDGTTFACDTTGMTYKMGETVSRKSFFASTSLSFAELNGKLYMADATSFAYGYRQNKGVYAYSSNGKDWTQIRPLADDETSICYIGGGAFFSFKGKLWMVGGYKSFISANNVTNAVYSSADGETWTKAGDLPEGMKGMYGMKVVANDDVAYMFGGVVITEDGRTVTNKIYSSTDGVNWTEVEVPTSYTARRNPRVVLVGNTVWIFGGITTAGNANYAYPEDTDVLSSDTWVKLLK